MSQDVSEAHAGLLGDGSAIYTRYVAMSFFVLFCLVKGSVYMNTATDIKEHADSHREQNCLSYFNSGQVYPTA